MYKYLLITIIQESIRPLLPCMISIKRFWLPPLAHIFPEASLPGADRESSSLLMLHGQGLDPFLYRVVVIFTSRLFEKSDKVGTKKLEHHYPPAFKVMYRESQHLSHVATFGGSWAALRAFGQSSDVRLNPGMLFWRRSAPIRCSCSDHCFYACSAHGTLLLSAAPCIIERAGQVIPCLPHLVAMVPGARHGCLCVIGDVGSAKQSQTRACDSGRLSSHRGSFLGFKASG